MTRSSRTSNTGWLLAGLLMLILLGLTPALLSDNLADNPPANIRVDESPLDPEIRSATSLAPIVKATSPSVVSVATTRFVPTRTGPGNPFRFFFDDSEKPKEEDLPRRLPIESMGSGVIVTDDGYILTNTHVVENVDEITVVLSDGETEYAARVVGKDELTDVAVLKVEAEDLSAITIGDPSTLEVGDQVLAIGSPFGLGQTVTSGIVSAKGRSGFYLHYEDFIQTDAPVNPGNSGGALVDAQGRLVGINTLILSEAGVSAGVNFAIPSNLARFVLDKVVRDGKVRRGYLGVDLAEKVTELLAAEFDLPDTRGALVTRVRSSGPAGDAGLEPGDFITHFNDAAITDLRSLQFEVAKTAPGTESEVRLVRDGKSKTLTVTLGELDERVFARRTEPAPRQPTEVLRGVETVDLTTSMRRQLEIPEDVEGSVLVTQVDPESAAHAAGLREGSLILEAQHREVSSVDEVMQAAEETDTGRLLLRVRGPDGAVNYLVISAKE